VLGGDDDQGRIEEVLPLKLVDHLADAGIDELDCMPHSDRRSPNRVGISSLDAPLDQLLSHAHRLEVHTEKSGYRSPVRAIVGLAVDLVQDRVDLKRVVALNV
jgi:hypothetical protein